jgi:hypothetical protein
MQDLSATYHETFSDPPWSAKVTPRHSRLVPCLTTTYDANTVAVMVCQNHHASPEHSLEHDNNYLPILCRKTKAILIGLQSVIREHLIHNSHGYGANGITTCHLFVVF